MVDSSFDRLVDDVGVVDWNLCPDDGVFDVARDYREALGGGPLEVVTEPTGIRPVVLDDAVAVWWSGQREVGCGLEVCRRGQVLLDLRLQ